METKACFEKGCTTPGVHMLKLLVPAKGDEDPKNRAQMSIGVIGCEEHFDKIAHDIVNDPALYETATVAMTMAGKAAPDFGRAEIVKVSILSDEYLQYATMMEARNATGMSIGLDERFELTAGPEELRKIEAAKMREMADMLEAGTIQQFYGVAMRRRDDDSNETMAIGAYTPGSLFMVLRRITTDLNCDCGNPHCNISNMGNALKLLLDGNGLAGVSATEGRRYDA